MTMAEVVSWQGAVIVALVLTNAASVAVALVAVSIIRLGASDLPAGLAKLLDRIPGTKCPGTPR
jgi:hypothetical protein